MSTDTFYSGSFTNSTQYVVYSEYSWFGYESPFEDGFKGGQGPYGWRNFKRCLLAVREIIAPFIRFNLPPRRRFDYRSEPRWKAERFKAKT